MKSLKLMIAFAVTLATSLSFGQAPEGFKYQAVVRDAGNTILTNQPVGMQLTIQQGSIGGTAVYTETFSPSTNAYGLVNLEIGSGTTVDDFSVIDWANGPYFIETSIDVTGGTSYSVMGTSQLMSVPYSLYSKTAGSAINDLVDDADADPSNELQAVSFSNDTLYLSNGGNVYLGSYAIDDQNISGSGLLGTNLTIGIEGGTSEIIDLSTLQDGTGTDDQNISGSSLSGTDLTIGIEGGTSEIVDLSTLQDGTGTDDQNISGSGLSGTDLTIGIEGGTNEIVDLSTLQDGTGTDDQNISGSGLSGTDLTIGIEGGSSETVDLSSLTDDGDWVLSSGDNWTNGNVGNIGIGNIASSQNRWQLTVKDTVDCMLSSDSIDVSELFGVFTRNLNENNTGIGIGFQSTSTVTGMGAAIVHERTSSNSRGKLHFATKQSSSAADEDLPIRMTLDETGDLGIGTTSPTEKLHISDGDLLADRGDNISGISRSFTLEGARNTDNVYAQFDMKNHDMDSGTDYTGASIRSNNGGDATENGNLKFYTYNGSLTEQMIIDEDGNVGIGESTPQTSLDVVDNAVIGNLSVGSESTAQGTSNLAGDGFTATPWLYTNAIEAQGERGSASTLITVGDDGTFGAADELHFVTSGASQMTVASDGKVGFDKTTPDTDLHIRQSQQSITNGTGGIKFEESGDPTAYWRIYHSGIYFSFNLEGSRVAYVNTTGAWTIDSDRNLKYDIKPLSSVLDRVMQLKPVDYLYNEQKPTENKVIGFVAQEVQPLFPEIVVESEENLGITYGATGVIAIKAIQEQQEIIKDQEVQIEQLQQQMLILMQEVNALKEAQK